MLGVLTGFLAAMLLFVSVPAVGMIEYRDAAVQDVEWECTVSTGTFHLVLENSGNAPRSYAILLEISSARKEVLSSRSVHAVDVAAGERRIVTETLPVKTGSTCDLWVW